MSTLRDALDGVKSILLLQNDVRNLEKEVERQRDALGELGDDFVALDKRVVRIETMIEMSAGQPQQKRIEE
ncbi:hypothetical protein [Pelagerythrobacter sp.]|uniref:hypothetical protein n=1 Tax=Pelagerythrobacter sp. TaxID=2800702 RepID=UPI0035AE9413